MIKEALQYIVSLSEPHYIEDGQGKKLSDRVMHRIDVTPTVSPLIFSTLGSLVDYITSGADDIGKTVYLHVKSPTRVELDSTIERSEDYMRQVFAVADAEIPSFQFGNFIPVENFIIAVKSVFQDYVPDPLDGPDKVLPGKQEILRYAGNIQSGTLNTCTDDGATQHAVVKTGIINKEDMIAPSIVLLKPYRTFLEVEQPVSEFLFRIKDDGNGVKCALFEADGFLWKHNAKSRVADFLEKLFLNAADELRKDGKAGRIPKIHILF